MPHIVIECSANVGRPADIQRLVDVVHAAALAHGLPAPDALRTRASVRSEYRIADGHRSNAFVAITARMAPGRSAEEKTSFLETILDAAEHELAHNSSLAIAYSAEVQEIDSDARINRNHVRERMEASDGIDNDL